MFRVVDDCRVRTRGRAKSSTCTSGKVFSFAIFLLGTYAILLFSDPITAVGADAIEANTIKKERVLMSIPCI